MEGHRDAGDTGTKGVVEVNGNLEDGNGSGAAQRTIWRFARRWCLVVVCFRIVLSWRKDSSRIEVSVALASTRS